MKKVITIKMVHGSHTYTFSAMPAIGKCKVAISRATSCSPTGFVALKTRTHSIAKARGIFSATRARGGVASAPTYSTACPRAFLGYGAG